jgi:hypothetical protein
VPTPDGAQTNLDVVAKIILAQQGMDHECEMRPLLTGTLLFVELFCREQKEPVLGPFSPMITKVIKVS